MFPISTVFSKSLMYIIIIDTVYPSCYLTLQVTNEYGSSCSFLGSPYINNCGYSAAYHILEHIYGDIKDANSSHIDENNVTFLLSFFV